MILGHQGAAAATQQAPADEPRSIVLDGVDEYVEVDLGGSLSVSRSFWIVFKAAALTGYELIGGADRRPYRLSSGSNELLQARVDNSGTMTYRRAATAFANDVWNVAIVTHAHGGFPVIYLNGSSAGSDATGTESGTPTEGVSYIGRYTSLHRAMSARAWGYIEQELTAGQVATLHAYLAANDDAGAAAWLAGLSATARHYGPRSTDDATGGTGSIAELTGNGSAATPYNTEAGDLSTDVPT